MDTFIKANLPFQSTKQNLLLVYANNKFLCTNQLQVLFPLNELLPTINQPNSSLISIGLWNNTAVYLVIVTEQTTTTHNTHWQALRPLMLQTNAITFKMLGYASQIANWAINHKFCGHCGTLMQRSNNEHRMTCPTCQFFAYPQLNPCIIVLVTHGDKILLARSPHFTPHMYSTLAGFIEPGESVENAIHREVFEEVGLTINNLRYITSQNWPYPHSLMLGFHANYVAGQITLQPEEIEDAQWFSIHQLPDLPPKQAIARYLIDLYIAERLATPQPTFPN